MMAEEVEMADAEVGQFCDQTCAKELFALVGVKGIEADRWKYN